MKQRLLVAGFIATMGLAPWAYTAEPIKYPLPRFPSYTKSPKSVEEVMPFARSIARHGDGCIPKRQQVVVDASALSHTDDMRLSQTRCEDLDYGPGPSTCGLTAPTVTIQSGPS